MVIPSGIVSTAWPRVVGKCAELGVEFDPWQHGIGSVALGKRADGTYAATVGGVVLSIPRQVGKTFLVGMIVIALCLLFPGLTVLWTAHHNRTATKTFLTLKGLTERPKVKPFMLPPRLSNGEQEVRFRNGSRIMFGAREQGFGRGFDEVDVEVFDEAQILSAKALEDMVPATNQSRQESGALLFFMGTPPRPTDPGEEFTARRKAALSGQSEDMVYVEFSADDDADPNDRVQWERANPSFPVRTPVSSMRRMRANLTDDASWMREALGVWDAAVLGGVIPALAWDARLLRVDAERVGTPVLSVDVSPQQTTASIGLAQRLADGRPLVGLAQDLVDGDLVVDNRPGTDWLLPRLMQLRDRHGTRQVALSGTAAESLRPALEAEGFQVAALSGPQMGQACAQLFAAATTDGGLAHLGQEPLDRALGLARRHDTETGWVWARKRPEGDITPVVAITEALWLLQTSRAAVPQAFWV